MHITYWYWLILSAGLIILELVAPAEFFLWIGIAAAVNALVVWLFPQLSWMAQLVSFSVLAILSLYLWHKLYKNPKKHVQPIIDHRGAQYIGRTFTLKEPIVDGIGKIKVDDTVWRVMGDDCETGSKIEITGISGVNLTVAKVE